MRSRFIGWYRWTPEEVSSIWDTAYFVPDANILLHCLRHPETVREQFLQLFEILHDSIWIPYQVGLEFHQNRLDVESWSRDEYDRVSKDYATAFQQARSRLRQLRAHPVINVEREIATLDKFVTELRERMKIGKGNHPAQAIGDTVDRLTALFDGRVGQKWEPERLKALIREGEERYAHKIPPGYMDSKKDTGKRNRFGDLIIWKDMMTKAKTEKRPIIFVSDDAKEDWWWIHREQRLGARPELIEEFRAATGQSFHIYDFGQFLREAADRNPAFKPGVTEIEESLRGDEQARKRLYDAAQAKALGQRIAELEHQRDMVISALSGTPLYGAVVEPTTDRSVLRERLDALNAELGAMNTALIQEMSPDS